jgi:hypothetical protein
LVAEGLKVISIAIHDGTMYGICSEDKQIYRHELAKLKRKSHWSSVAKVPEAKGREEVNAQLKSIAIHHGTIYAVSEEGVLCKQNLHDMTIYSPWITAAEGEWLAIAIAPNVGVIFAVGTDKKVYRQELGKMTVHSMWVLAGAGEMSSIAINGGQVLIDLGMIFGIGTDSKMYKQALGKMSASSTWSLVSKDDMIDVAVDQAPENKGLMEQRLNLLQHYGKDVMRFKTGNDLKAKDWHKTEALNMTVERRAVSGMVRTEPWNPVRSRKNAHALNYTSSLASLPQLSATA